MGCASHAALPMHGPSSCVLDLMLTSSRMMHGFRCAALRNAVDVLWHFKQFTFKVLFKMTFKAVCEPLVSERALLEQDEVGHLSIVMKLAMGGKLGAADKLTCMNADIRQM